MNWCICTINCVHFGVALPPAGAPCRLASWPDRTRLWKNAVEQRGFGAEGPHILFDRPQTCGLRARFPDCLSTHRFAGFDGQQSGRECIFPFRTVPQFSMVVPLRSQARLWHSLLHWAYSALFRAQRARFVRPSPSAGRCSVPAHFVCSALQPFGPSPFCKHLLPKNTRNDVHAVISD